MKYQEKTDEVFVIFLFTKGVCLCQVPNSMLFREHAVPGSHRVADFFGSTLGWWHPFRERRFPDKGSVVVQGCASLTARGRGVVDARSAGRKKGPKYRGF